MLIKFAFIFIFHLFQLPRDTPNSLGIEKVAARFKEFKLSGLLIIGGFEAYDCLIELVEGREKYPELCIPMAMVPATISNNVPGTDFSLGCDTALNEITSVSYVYISKFYILFLISILISILA